MEEKEFILVLRFIISNSGFQTELYDSGCKFSRPFY